MLCGLLLCDSLVVVVVGKVPFRRVRNTTIIHRRVCELGRWAAVWRALLFVRSFLIVFVWRAWRAEKYGTVRYGSFCIHHAKPTGGLW